MESMKLGWIGTGVMGNSMCSHLLAAGHAIAVYNRTREKAASLIAGGATWCDSPRAVAEQSEIVFTIVGFPADVEAVTLGEQGTLAGAGAGAVLVDMTTSSPELAQRIHLAANERGVDALDAPVSGGDVGAREATLAIMVGGEQQVFDTVKPLFEIMGKNIAFMGAPGAGQHTKMCNQILVAGTMIGTVESLLYAQRMGMSLDAVIDVIGQGAARSWLINNLGRRIAAGDYEPGFYIKHFVKDMGIALDEAHRGNLALPGLSLVNQFYLAAQALGLENLGTQGLYKVLAHLNDMRGEES
ncbi:MAG: NAD(P)-dependent oxidoreductase [Desulfofustis sp. PB-SRB1]|jgi:3-hydroxyisobutyrate dehydrogenase|nr:NAD(P)-dependent oxidoreductase [Desulfofustis sp. PB-SRB1]MBM1000786.1 NAD(P)-dependent oxidoreductase [Desulfofustis sp. PB-SRB1]HBH27835.1 NAD(P)-dependent oxidoreductase [Desulfofustis sp.]